MAEWELAQKHPSEELALLHFFAIKKQQPGGDVEFQIVVREYVMLGREDNRQRRFFAQANKQTNQSVAPYTPCGWGSTLGVALAECVREIRRFPYEGPMTDINAPVS